MDVKFGLSCYGKESRLRNLSEPKRKEVMEERRKWHSDKLQYLHSLLDMVQIIKGRRMR
jgi:hypothetical protein